MVTYHCPHCNAPIEVPESAANTRHVCRSCGQGSLVPGREVTHGSSQTLRPSRRTVFRRRQPVVDGDDVVDAAACGCCLLSCLDFGCSTVAVVWLVGLGVGRLASHLTGVSAGSTLVAAWPLLLAVALVARVGWACSARDSRWS